MRCLGLDLGTRTLGISMRDATETIASPYTILRFSEGDYDSILPEISKIVEEYKIGKIVLGLPKNMNNTIGDRGVTTMEFQNKLENYLNIPVVLQDERLSTVAAINVMVEADISRKKRKEKVDSVAANIILQTYLDRMKGR